MVSAFLDAYLEPWCAAMGVDMICTQLEISASSTLFIGTEAMKPGTRSGCLVAISARLSLASRASAGASAGEASASMGGAAPCQRRPRPVVRPGSSPEFLTVP